MNCLDFRRRWLTVPNARDLALAQHERVCSGCRQFARRGSVFEPKLREALTVEVPAGLTDRIRQRRDIGEQVRERQVRPLRYALALSLALVAGLGLLLGYQLLAPAARELQFQHTIVQHMAAEIRQLHGRRELPMAKVRPLFARFGAELQGDLGRVNFAAACSIGSHPGVHMVLQGRQGPVNVVYIDGAQVEGRSRIHEELFSGFLFPAGTGSIAVVSARRDGVRPVVERLKDKLRWGA